MVHINVSISNSSGSTWISTFTVTIPDGQTQYQTIPTTLDPSYAQGIGTSAEWISEEPSDQNNNLLPMADISTVSYQSADSSNGVVLISASDIGTDGESFVITNTNTTRRHHRRKQYQCFFDWNSSN